MSIFQMILVIIIMVSIIYLKTLYEQPDDVGRRKGQQDTDKEERKKVTEEVRISIRCFSCGEAVSVYDKKCPYCGFIFESIIPITENKLPENKLKEDSEQNEKNEQYTVKIKKKRKKKNKKSNGLLTMIMCVAGLLAALLFFISVIV